MIARLSSSRLFWCQIGSIAAAIAFVAGPIAFRADAEEVSLVSPKSTVWRVGDQAVRWSTAPGSERTPKASRVLWRERSFDDSAWPTAKGLIGYGDGDIVSRISFGSDPQHKRTAALFRTRFRRIRSNRRGRLIGGRLVCDDGAVVWVNGVEVYRYNMPAGAVRSNTFAVRSLGPDAAEERARHPFIIPEKVLKDGDNLLAVSVHQATSTSSDLAMSLEVFEATDESTAQSFVAEVANGDDRETGGHQHVQVKIGPVARLRFAND